MRITQFNDVVSTGLLMNADGGFRASLRVVRACVLRYRAVVGERDRDSQAVRDSACRPLRGYP